MKYEDLLKSDVAIREGISNIPNSTAKSNLTLLKINILDRIPQHFIVTSGYRSEELNKKVCGSDTSDHKYGKAADIDSDNNLPIFNWIKNNCDFKQLIWEKGGQWIHVSYDISNNKKQILYL